MNGLPNSLLVQSDFGGIRSGRLSKTRRNLSRPMVNGEAAAARRWVRDIVETEGLGTTAVAAEGRKFLEEADESASF